MNILVFDMDGTIANLYGVDGWLEKLNRFDPSPYVEAEPLYNMEVLNAVLEIFKGMGWKIVVTTWLSKNGTPAYNALVREAKIEWLDRFNFPYDEIHLVKYGTTKADCTRKHGGFQILIDDNETVRNGWHLGDTINANENIIEKLLALLEQQCLFFGRAAHRASGANFALYHTFADLSIANFNKIFCAIFPAILLDFYKQ